MNDYRNNVSVIYNISPIETVVKIVISQQAITKADVSPPNDQVGLIESISQNLLVHVSL